jgi:Deoxyribonuclease II
VLALMRVHIVSCRWPALMTDICAPPRGHSTFHEQLSTDAAQRLRSLAVDATLDDVPDVSDQLSGRTLAAAVSAEHWTGALPAAADEAALCCRVAQWQLPPSADVSVTLFAKPPGVALDIWDVAVREGMQCSGMAVESWRHERHELPEFCHASGCTVNAAGVMGANGTSWTIGQDHSKWAACCDQSIVCFGDLNRAEPQTVRGGSVVCFSGQGAHGVFEWLSQALIVAPSSCSNCSCST